VSTRWQRFRHRRRLARMAGVRLLAAFADAYPAATFVEIGANDGERHDHLRPFILERGWTGLMVEPLPDLFARLEANYAGIDRVTPVQAAVSAGDGTRTLYHLAPDPDLPYWQDMIASFERDVLLAHAGEIAGLEERIVTTEVPTLTFASLCTRHGLDRVDLLVCDTEGHDWAILGTVDLDRHRPRLVIYEHFHLSPADRAAAREHFTAAGYRVLEEGFDTFALDPLPDGLTARFERLEPQVEAVTAS
jgi:FkbM family methyltransferase